MAPDTWQAASVRFMRQRLEDTYQNTFRIVFRLQCLPDTPAIPVTTELDRCEFYLLACLTIPTSFVTPATLPRLRRDPGAK